MLVEIYSDAQNRLAVMDHRTDRVVVRVDSYDHCIIEDDHLQRDRRHYPELAAVPLDEVDELAHSTELHLRLDDQVPGVESAAQYRFVARFFRIACRHYIRWKHSPHAFRRREMLHPLIGALALKYLDTARVLLDDEFGVIGNESSGSGPVRVQRSGEGVDLSLPPGGQHFESRPRVERIILVGDVPARHK
ncbi:hypothetical protein [Kribbella speibonae]|uniref:hypothetical protein n=1 Tax=Kribbella speibonae TaxID=1572660 RepID=UPI001EDD092B|nr:hypothetical protein [Kribbella speibonae]